MPASHRHPPICIPKVFNYFSKHNTMIWTAIEDLPSVEHACHFVTCASNSMHVGRADLYVYLRCTVGPLIINLLWAKKQVSTEALGGPDNPPVVQTNI